MKLIADTGFLVALLDRADSYHRWAASLVEKEEPPFITCEAVCAEAAAVLGTADPILLMVERGDLALEFSLADETPAVRKLVRKYRDQPMDLADACVVRLSELNRISRVITVDRRDFMVYRRFGNQPIPCAFPT